MRTPRTLDVLLAGVGVLFGASSLAWPFGWDTSVHYYVGREWLLRGAIPYRDTFDHKTPGIHLAHALTVFLFGEGMWGIRLFELGCVVLVGWACATLALDRRSRPGPAGLRGATVLAANVLYYGFFDYWNTAQCELLGTTLATLVVLAAIEVRTPLAAAALSGLLTGAAIAVKPPFLLFAIVALFVLWTRAARVGRPSRAASVLKVLAAYGATTLAIPAILLAYFAAHGALRPMGNILVWCNLVYLRDEQRLHSMGEVVGTLGIMWRFFCPVASLLLVTSIAAVAHAAIRREGARLRRWALAAALLAVGFGVVASQLKFYLYNWITELSAVTLVVANAMVDIARWVRPRRRAWVPAAACALVAGAYTRTGVQFEGWHRTTTATVAWLTGKTTRAQFASTFQTWDGLRKYGDLEVAGLWIRDHSRQGDFVLARGIATEVYVVSGRWAPGRFFWTAFLTRPSRRFHRDEWLAEDEKTIDEKKPRWVVAFGPAVFGVDSEAFFLSKGYVERARFGAQVILERRESDEQRAASSAP